MHASLSDADAAQCDIISYALTTTTQLLYSSMARGADFHRRTLSAATTIIKTPYYKHPTRYRPTVPIADGIVLTTRVRFSTGAPRVTSS